MTTDTLETLIVQLGPTRPTEPGHYLCWYEAMGNRPALLVLVYPTRRGYAVRGLPHISSWIEELPPETLWSARLQFSQDI